MPNEEICEFCDRRPATTLLMGAFACSRCRADVLGWPPVEIEKAADGDET